MKQIGIIGASGYTGVELLRLLSDHPDLLVKVVTADTILDTEFMNSIQASPSHIQIYPTNHAT